MKTLLLGLFKSKKFMAAIIGSIVALGARYGLRLDPDMVQNIVYLFLTYIGAQGLADFRKEEAKMNAAAAVDVPQARKMIQDPGKP